MRERDEVKQSGSDCGEELVDHHCDVGGPEGVTVGM